MFMAKFDYQQQPVGYDMAPAGNGGRAHGARLRLRPSLDGATAA
jgi:hypothetical protein